MDLQVCVSSAVNYIQCRTHNPVDLCVWLIGANWLQATVTTTQL